MSRLFVTLAVLVILHNDMTFGHFHPFHGPGHPGHRHHPGHIHPPGFYPGHRHPPGFHPGHPPGFHPGHGHPPGFPFGPGHPPGLGQYNPEITSALKSVQGQQEPGLGEIRKKYAEILDILNKSCRNNSIVPKIVYSTTSYVIIYNLPETKDLKATVTIQNQILSTEVTGTGVFKGFSDVIVLPDILKVSDATWTFVGSDLKILIPYKAKLGTQFTTECTPGNGAIIEVKKPTFPDLFPRMLDD